MHYRGFHGIATSEGNARKAKIQGKVDFWKNRKSSKQDEELPPSILVVGIDSTSRINFRRNMFKTQKVLQSLGAVEMFGYTKVGENTFPNFCPMFLGYSAEDVFKVCMLDYMDYQDDCPSIWKQVYIFHFLFHSIRKKSSSTILHIIVVQFEIVGCSKLFDCSNRRLARLHGFQL